MNGNTHNLCCSLNFTTLLCTHLHFFLIVKDMRINCWRWRSLGIEIVPFILLPPLYSLYEKRIWDFILVITPTPNITHHTKYHTEYSIVFDINYENINFYFVLRMQDQDIILNRTSRTNKKMQNEMTSALWRVKGIKILKTKVLRKSLHESSIQNFVGICILCI